ncbi:hypothetical protein [Actinomyces viscosus]|uniref:hypothetical protein n=1 Tax=Actinomyces viscosus TaxID=1656 RepID=UPI0028EAF4DD|nr:hypothetical protein [Actinomyces viscosus]
MSVRRRAVLALGVTSLASGAAGCTPFTLVRNKRKQKVREYLSGLDGVTSVEVDVSAGLLEDDRWMVNVTLKDDPDLESVLAIVRDARNKVISIADTDKMYMDVTWDQGATTVACHLPLNDAEKAVSAAVGTVSSDMERVSVSEERISLDYRSVKTLSDNFVLPPTSPVLQVSSLKTEQDVLVGGSYCFISHFRGIDLTSVPVKNVVEAIPSDQRPDAVVNLEAENAVNQATQLRVSGLGEYGAGVDVASAGSVLAAVLGNQVLQRVELGTTVNDSYDSEIVAFDMEAGAVVGSGDPPEQGAAILAAAQQAAASS